MSDRCRRRRGEAGKKMSKSTKKEQFVSSRKNDISTVSDTQRAATTHYGLIRYITVSFI